MSALERYNLVEAARKINRVLNQDWDWQRLLQSIVTERRYIQILCWADDVPVKEVEAIYSDFSDFIRRTIDPFNFDEEEEYIGIDAWWSGSFYPGLSPDGKDYLNALAYGDKPAMGIQRIRDREDQMLKHVDMPGGYKPTQQRLYIEAASLGVLMNSLREEKSKHGMITQLPESERQQKYRGYRDSGYNQKSYNGFHYITPQKAAELLSVHFDGDEALQMVLEGFAFAIGDVHKHAVTCKIGSGEIEQFEDHTRHGWRRVPKSKHDDKWGACSDGWVKTKDIETAFSCDLSGWTGRSSRKITITEIDQAAEKEGIPRKHINAISSLYSVVYTKNPEFDFAVVDAGNLKGIGLDKLTLQRLVNTRMIEIGHISDSKEAYEESESKSGKTIAGPNFERNVFQKAMQILRVLHGGSAKIK